MKNKSFFKRCLLILLIIGEVFAFKELFQYIKILAEKSYRLEVHFGMLNKWLTNRENKKSIGSYLAENNLHNIAIYGLGLFGTHLLNDLQEDRRVNVVYGIDRSVQRNNNELKIYRPDECLPQVDAVIVSVVFSFDEIKEMLGEKMDCPIISLEELIGDM